jgi:uncharacterized protein YjdB
VAKVPVGSVDVTPQSPTITTGATTQLTATVRDANNTIVTDRVVTWATSNPAFVTVNASGTITGVAPGTATVTATSEGKSGSTTVTVSLIAVSTVVVAPTTLALTTGQTGTLAATVTDANGNVVTNRPVTWSSSDDLKATVSQTGVVTGVAAGSVTITAASGGKSGTAAVTVSSPPVTPPQPAAVAVTPNTATLTVGQGTSLTATVTRYVALRTWVFARTGRLQRRHDHARLPATAD